MLGKRKLFIAVLFGCFAFVAFFFTQKTVSDYTALIAALAGIAGWYHQSNVTAKRIHNGKE